MCHSKERDRNFLGYTVRELPRENGGNTVTNRHLDRIRFVEDRNRIPGTRKSSKIKDKVDKFQFWNESRPQEKGFSIELIYVFQLIAWVLSELEFMVKFLVDQTYISFKVN